MFRGFTIRNKSARIDFVDLLYGDTKKEKKEFKDKFGHELIEMTEIDNFNDISKLAALINACDFVITTRM